MTLVASLHANKIYIYRHKEEDKRQDKDEEINLPMVREYGLPFGVFEHLLVTAGDKAKVTKTINMAEVFARPVLADMMTL